MAETRPRGWLSESLDDWREIARDARATLRTAQLLRAGQLAPPEEWEAIRGKGTRLSGFGVIGFVREGPWKHDAAWEAERERERQAKRAIWVTGGPTLADQHRSFWNAMDGWVLRGGVRPFLEWGPGMKPTIRLGGWSLYGAIAVQLLFEVSRTGGMVICTSCGTPFLPAARRPRWDQNAYCLDCGRKAAARDAAARYRRTEKYQQARLRRQKQAATGQSTQVGAGEAEGA